MPSIQYKMVNGLFKLIGVNKMLDKKGSDFDKLLESYKEKQKKPLKVPYKKMADFNIETKTIDGTTCYVVRAKDTSPQIAVLYLFGGGYILPPDPGDIVLCGQIAENCNAEVWFPLYPMAPEHRLVETLQSTLKIYQEILKKDEAYLLSPLLYDLTGFPETDVFYGTREVMIAYLKDFQAACKKYGVILHTHIGKGMMHCWGAMEFVPEAKAVRQEYFAALR